MPELPYTVVVFSIGSRYVMRIKDSHVKSNGEYGMLISLIWTTIPGLGESSGPLFFAWQEKQLICVLTSFLEAHAHARRQIPHYLGETEGIDTPEESLVVQESKQLTKEALLKLSEIPSVTMIENNSLSLLYVEVDSTID